MPLFLSPISIFNVLPIHFCLPHACHMNVICSDTARHLCSDDNHWDVNKYIILYLFIIFLIQNTYVIHCSLNFLLLNLLFEKLTSSHPGSPVYNSVKFSSSSTGILKNLTSYLLVMNKNCPYSPNHKYKVHSQVFLILTLSYDH